MAALVYTMSIALFTDNILHLHHNEIEHECEAISGKHDKIARNCLVSTLNCIVMQISKVIREKGYCITFIDLILENTATAFHHMQIS